MSCGGDRRKYPHLSVQLTLHVRIAVHKIPGVRFILGNDDEEASDQGFARRLSQRARNQVPVDVLLDVMEMAVEFLFPGLSRTLCIECEDQKRLPGNPLDRWCILSQVDPAAKSSSRWHNVITKYPLLQHSPAGIAMMNPFAKAATLAIVLVVVHAGAAPVTDTDRVPIDLRRTTLVVHDMDASLAFYRDALGLEVIYDNLIRTPRDAPTDDDAQSALRLVFLRANDDYVGIVGLLQFRKPARTAPEQTVVPFSTGSTVLLFNAEDLASTFEKARAVPGVTVLNAPRVTEYPAYDGEGTISVNVSVLIDPDGFVVELNQLLEDLH